jgi:nucleotide-binding universal stress UspA family protein
MNTHVPLRSILLATNLADIEWLFPFTCSLAEESGARVTVLHVIPAMNGFSVDLAGFPYYDPREALAAAKEQLKESCARACQSRIESQVIAMDGTPGDGILSMAAQVQADLLVMGTRAYRGMDKWLHGSVAEEVLRSSPIPVITVGPHARKAAAAGVPIRSIVFATSLKAQSTDVVNVSLIYKWIERLHGHLTLLHVAPDEHKHKIAQETHRARERELRSLLPNVAFDDGLVDFQVRTGRACHEILAAAVHADLITLGAVPNSMLGRLAPEGTLNQILAAAHCPVVSFHSDHGRARPA